MKQLVISESSKKLIHVIIGIKTGWRNEKEGKTGMTHYLEHAIFLGNKQYPKPDPDVAKFGVRLNGRTLPEHTLFDFTSHKNDFSYILKLFLSLIFHPEFNKIKMEKEKNENIVTAANQESDYCPWDLAQEWALNLIFNWDCMKSLGTREDIISITREEILMWHSKHYHTDNSFIFTYGDIGENEVSKIIKNADIPQNNIFPSPVDVQYKERDLFIERKNMRNVEMVYGFNLPQYNPAWEILRIILGNYPDFRLWDEDFSRFTYTLGSELKWTTSNGGFFLYFGATSTEGTEEIDNNLWKLLKNFELLESELEIAKKIRSLEILKMREGGESGLLRFFLCNSMLMYKNFNELIESFTKITKDEIISLVRELLTKENSVRIRVGNK